jgi:serine/threonine protein kinase
MTNEKPFDRAALDAADKKLLRDGHIANAVVSLVTVGGRKWTVKDFSARPWYVRWFLAPYLLHHELSILKRLKGVDGVAGEAFRIDGCALAIEYTEGTSMGHVPREKITPAFLESFEKLLKTVHERGVVHLDVRGTGNVMYRPDGTPALIDFQASVPTRWLPGPLRRLLEDIDMSGAYKKWAEYQPDAMGDFRRAEWKRTDRLRRLWIFRGYLGLRK